MAVHPKGVSHCWHGIGRDKAKIRAYRCCTCGYGGYTGLGKRINVARFQEDIPDPVWARAARASPQMPTAGSGISPKPAPCPPAS